MKNFVKDLRRGIQSSIRDRDPVRLLESVDEAIDSKQISIKDASIKQLFEELFPSGREMVASWDPRQGGSGGVKFSAVRASLLGNAAPLIEYITDTPMSQWPRDLLEESGAVTYGAFSHITGQLVFSAILAGFGNEEFVFSKIVENIPTMFNGERIPGMSHLGDGAEVVPESQPYPMIGVSEDWIDTPQTLKRGLMDAITKQAIFFDRTALVEKRCNEVGEFLGLNKEKRIIDAVIDQNAGAVAGPNSHRYKWKGTTYASFQTVSPWNNVKSSNGLTDWTNVDALEQVGQKILDPFTNEPINLDFTDLVVARQNKWIARRIAFATQVTNFTPGFALTGNPNQTFAANPVDRNYRILSSNQLGARMTAASEANTDWFIGDVAKAVKYMENWPIQVQQAPPSSEDEYKRDIVMSWKASERGAAAVYEPRYLLKGTL